MGNVAEPYRDLSIITVTDDVVCVTASERLTSTGNREYDRLCVSSEIIAQIRFSLLELLCIKVRPNLLNNLAGDEMEPTAKLFNFGPHKELAKAVIEQLLIDVNWWVHHLKKSLHELLPISLKGTLIEGQEVAEINGLNYKILNDYLKIYQLNGLATSLLVIGSDQIATQLQDNFSDDIRIGEFV